MDTRTLYAAILSGLAMVAATVLAIAGEATAAATMGGLASSGLLFVIGLHSEPRDPNIIDVEVIGDDEDAHTAPLYADPVSPPSDELDASKEG